jgi:cation transport ATPase
MKVLGILKFASYLEHSRLSSIAKIVFFIAASMFQWSYMKAPEAVNAVLLRQLSVACTLCVYFFAGIPAAFSLLLDLASLKIDTHVLMNLAVVGTLVAGLPLEGALLLVLFQTSHAVEHMLTDKAQGSLKALFDSIPNHADVVDIGEDGQIDLSSTRHVRTSDVKVGETILVKPGCQVCIFHCYRLNFGIDRVD